VCVARHPSNELRGGVCEAHRNGYNRRRPGETPYLQCQLDGWSLGYVYIIYIYIIIYICVCMYGHFLCGLNIVGIVAGARPFICVFHVCSAATGMYTKHAVRVVCSNASCVCSEMVRTTPSSSTQRRSSMARMLGESSCWAVCWKPLLYV